ncbi:hypothetical protein ACA910_000514 [Epithemia clementina (nom. ined.)]
MLRSATRRKLFQCSKSSSWLVYHYDFHPRGLEQRVCKLRTNHVGVAPSGSQACYGGLRYFTIGERPSSHPHVSASSQNSVTEESSKTVLLLLLDRKKRPLGTLNWEDWESGMRVFARSLDLLPFQDDGTTQSKNSNDYDSQSTDQSNEENTNPWIGMGRRVLEADKLLQRLSLEAATRSFVARSFLQPLDLTVMSIAALESWIRVHLAFPKTPSPLQFARSRLQCLIQELRKVRSMGVEIENDGYDAIYKSFIDLVHGFNNLQTTEGTEQAVDLLASTETSELFQHNPQQIIPFFHDFLQHLLSTSGAEKSASRLLTYMEHTAQSVPSWKGIGPTDQHIQEAFGLGDSSVASQDRATLIEQSESRSLVRHMLSRIEKSTEKDDLMTQEAIALIEVLDSQELRSALSLSLAEYFVRISDVVNAIVWIARVGADDIASFEQRGSELLGKSIDLWIQRREEDASAAYRAEEILELFEKVSEINRHSIDQRLYLALAKSWMSSDELWGCEKATNIALRSGTPNIDLLVVALEACKKNPRKNQVDALLTAHRWYTDLLETMSPEHAQKYGAMLVSVLSGADMTNEALGVLQSVLDGGVSLSPDAFECIHDCWKQPQQRLHVLDMMASSNKPLDPKVALTAIQLLEPNEHNGHWQVLDRLLSPAIFSGVAASEELPSFVDVAIKKLLAWNDPKRALSVLEEAELHLSKNAESKTQVLPLEYYRHVLTGLVQHQQGRLASKIFRRLRERESGPYPESNFCEHYLSIVRGTGSWLVNESTNILRWLVGMYKKTGDSAFKPKATMYTKILYFLYLDRDHQESVASKAENLIEEMVELQAHDGDPRPFHQAFQIACKCDRDERFECGLKFYQRMHSTEGVKVDAIALQKFLWTCMFYRDTKSAPFQLRMALDCIGQARQNGIVSEQIFSLGFQIVGRLANFETREPLIERLFQMCCFDGYLDSRVRTEVRDMLPEQSWHRIYSAHLDHENREPDSWSRNVEVGNIERRLESKEAV